MHTDAIEVRVEGSTGTPYVATFSLEGGSLKTACSCPAGEKKMHCKHRLALLAGNLSAVLGVMPSGLAEQLSTMVRGTQLEVALQELEVAEAEAKVAAERVKRAKKVLDRVMHN